VTTTPSVEMRKVDPRARGAEVLPPWPALVLVADVGGTLASGRRSGPSRVGRAIPLLSAGQLPKRDATSPWESLREALATTRREERTWLSFELGWCMSTDRR
jgi:hypothetical protein